MIFVLHPEKLIEKILIEKINKWKDVCLNLTKYLKNGVDT